MSEVMDERYGLPAHGTVVRKGFHCHQCGSLYAERDSKCACCQMLWKLMRRLGRVS